MSLFSFHGVYGERNGDEDPQIMAMVAEGGPPAPDPDSLLEKYLASGGSLKEFLRKENSGRVVVKTRAEIERL